MRPLVFASPLGEETASHSDWKSVEQVDTPGVATPPDSDELNREKGCIRLTPRQVKPKPFKKPQDYQSGDPGFNTELHRDIGRINHGGDPFMHPQPFDQPSPSSREYYYAPGDHGLSSAKIKATYQDDADTSETLPKSGGYINRETDSNFSMKPQTWRFRKKDHDLSLAPGGKGEEEPTDWSVVEQGEHSLPLTSAYCHQLFFAGVADFDVAEHQYSFPRQQSQGTKDWKAFRSFVSKIGDSLPRYVVDFHIVRPQGKRGFILDPNTTGVYYYDADAVNEVESGLNQRFATQVAKFLPAAVVGDAVQQMVVNAPPTTTKGIPAKWVSYEEPKEKAKAESQTPEERELVRLEQENKKAAAELKRKELEQKQKKLRIKDDELKVREELDKVKLEKMQRKLQEQKEKESVARQKSEIKAPGEVGTEEIPVPAKSGGEGEARKETGKTKARPSVAITPEVSEELGKMGFLSVLRGSLFFTAEQGFHLGNVVVKTKSKAGQGYEVPVYKAEISSEGAAQDFSQVTPMFTVAFTMSENGAVNPESIVVRRADTADVVSAEKVSALLRGLITTEAANLVKEIASAEGKEKVEKPAEKPYPRGRGYGFNVLKDPLLETKEKGGMLDTEMLPQEKLFTTIKSWPQNTITVDTNRVDRVAKALLEEKPKGDGDFFKWSYISESGVAELQKKETEAQGFSRLPGGASLMVTQKQKWINARDEIQKARNQ